MTLHLAVVLDVGSRRLIGYSMASHARAEYADQSANNNQESSHNEWTKRRGLVNPA